eukprot:849616_1
MLLSSDRVGVNRSIRMNRRKTSTQYGLRYMKKLSFLVVAMGAILLVTNAISIRQSQHYVINVWQNNFYSNTTPQPQSDESTTDPPEEAQYKTFSSFVGIPNFYTKDPHQPVAPNGNLLTICSMCSLNILPQSKALATNYQSGPLSLAVYIGRDITYHTRLRPLLLDLFDEQYHNTSSPYDINIALLYRNKSSLPNESSTTWRLPYNILKNLAEYQVQTKWLMNVDLDFELYSSTMHDSVYLNTMLGDADTYSNHTIFIVPAFALNSSYVEEGTDYNNLTRTQLISLIPKQISPFGKTCLHYSKWYKTQSDYTLDLSDLKHCRPRHEPFFIMNSNISREYSWDTRFAATQSLRHHNFIAIVLRDVFMIHVSRTAAGSMHGDTISPKAVILLKRKQPSSVNELYPVKSQQHIQVLLNRRLKMPTNCKDDFHIEPMDHNWLPYYSRCKYMPFDLHHSHPPAPDGAIVEGIITKQFIYSHVFKAGGTTINHGIFKLIKNKKLIHLTPYKDTLFARNYMLKNKTYDYSNIASFMDNKTVTFTFIRDPLSKFLSAFFEVSKRFVTDIRYQNKKKRIESAMKIDYQRHEPLDILRKFIRKIKTSYLVYNDTLYHTHTVFDHRNYLDDHYKPNLFYLMPRSNRNKSLNFNFIGNINELTIDLPQILNPFINDTKLQNNATLLMEYFEHQRDRNSQTYETHSTEQFNIDKSELSEQDIQNICEIYWMDYICFPFEIPEPCNITYLMHKHYGSDVEYDDEEC